MNRKLIPVFVAAVAFVFVGINQGFAQKTDNAAKSPAKPAVAAREKVTFELRGAECDACAKTLMSELSKHGITTTVVANKDKPVRLFAEIDPMTDLGACGKAIMDAKTAHREHAAPELDLVMFTKLDKDSAAKVKEALAKIKGVDAKQSMVNLETGEICIRLNGAEKVTANTLQTTLKTAGVYTNFVKGSTPGK
jgi:hypothetical protein